MDKKAEVIIKLVNASIAMRELEESVRDEMLDVIL